MGRYERVLFFTGFWVKCGTSPIPRFQLEQSGCLRILLNHKAGLCSLRTFSGLTPFFTQYNVHTHTAHPPQNLILNPPIRSLHNLRRTALGIHGGVYTSCSFHGGSVIIVPMVMAVLPWPSFRPSFMYQLRDFRERRNEGFQIVISTFLFAAERATGPRHGWSERGWGFQRLLSQNRGLFSGYRLVSEFLLSVFSVGVFGFLLYISNPQNFLETPSSRWFA